MGRNRKVTCLVCGKCMRSDTLKAHNLTHKDLLSLPEDEIKEELKARHAQQLERESQAAKLRLIKKIAIQEQLSIPPRTSCCPNISIPKISERPNPEMWPTQDHQDTYIDCPNISIPKISERTKNVLIA